MSSKSKMDRICANCGQRFGGHYGSGEPVFCKAVDFTTYLNTKEKPSTSKLFVDGGRRKTRYGIAYSEKDPNFLFKRRG